MFHVFSQNTNFSFIITLKDLQILQFKLLLSLIGHGPLGQDKNAFFLWHIFWQQLVCELFERHLGSK